VTRLECTDDPDLWFRTDEASVAAAKRICARCPLRNPCAEQGRDEAWGVWGGLDAGDRLALQLLATPEPPPHVASRGCYVAGCTRPECCEANTRWIAEWRARDRPAHVTAGESIDVCEQLSIGLEIPA
jgi:hypothetical protein